jgi:hypothetical protein
LSPEYGIKSHNIKVANKSFENVAEVRCLGMTMTNQNCICGEVKNRLNSGNSCCVEVENIVSSCPLSTNIKITVYKTNFIWLFYVDETCSITLREEQRLNVFVNRVLRRKVKL